MDAERRSEDRLLIECVRQSVGSSDIVTARRLLANGLDWPYLIRTATRHQVLPLLRRTLADCERTGAIVAPEARATVQQELDTRITRNRRLAAELVRLARLAADANLALLPFKGAVLAADVYGDLALRQFADIDFLVDASQSAAADAFLRALGYESRLDFGWEAHFIHRESGLCVDLHRGRLTPQDFPVAEMFPRFWKRRTAVWIDGGRIETLCIDDLLITLCIQAARDAWQGKTRLGKLCDIAHVLNAGHRISWSAVQAEARMLGVARVLEFGIELTRRITQVTLPAALAPVAQAGIATLVGQEERRLFEDANAPPSAVQGHLYHFHLRERWRDKLRPYRARWLSLMRPSRRDREALPLPRVLSWAHYVVRPVLVLRRYGRYLLRGQVD